MKISGFLRLFLIFLTVFICTPAFGEKTYSWQNLNWKNSLIISDIVDYENYDNQIPSFISFKYPLELSWFSENDLGFPDLQSYSLTFGPINLQKISFPLKGEDAFFIASTVQTFVYNPEISRRDNSSGIPHLWNSSQSPIIGQKRSGRLVLGNNNISMLIDMGFNILGNRAGHSVIDSIVTTLGFSYSVKSKILYKKDLFASVNLNVQTQEMLPWDDKIKKLEPKNMRSYFVSPGLTLGNKSIMLEGLIRLPVYEAQNTDALFKPELQGRLGLKWFLPEMMKP